MPHLLVDHRPPPSLDLVLPSTRLHGTCAASRRPSATRSPFARPVMSRVGRPMTLLGMAPTCGCVSASFRPDQIGRGPCGAAPSPRMQRLGRGARPVSTLITRDAPRGRPPAGPALPGPRVAGPADATESGPRATPVPVYRAEGSDRYERLAGTPTREPENKSASTSFKWSLLCGEGRSLLAKLAKLAQRQHLRGHTKWDMSPRPVQPSRVKPASRTG